MTLLRQLVMEKLKSYEEKALLNKYEFWDLYQAFNLSAAGLGLKLDKKNVMLRNKLYKNIVAEKDKEKSFVIISHLMLHDRKVINMFLDESGKIKVEDDKRAQVYKKGVIGVLDFELGG